MSHLSEWLSQRLDCFAELRNLRGFQSPQAFRVSQHEVADLIGIDFHQPAASRVHRQEVVSHDEGAERLGVAHERAVAFHADDAVHDREIGRSREGDIDDAVVDAAPMEFVLRPAVADARNSAEQVLK